MRSLSRYSTRSLEGRTRARGPHIYIRTGGQSVRTRPLDRNVGAARRVAHGKGPDPKIRNESSGQVSPSQVRDACGPHGNEPTPKAIARNFVTFAHDSAGFPVPLGFSGAQFWYFLPAELVSGVFRRNGSRTNKCQYICQMGAG